VTAAGGQYEGVTQQSPHGAGDTRSVGELVGDVAKDLSTLMRQEVELAKVELKQEASKAAKAGGLLGGAGVAGPLLAIFASLAPMFALGSVMPLRWAALIVAALWGVVAAVLYAMGRSQLKTIDPVPRQTVETVKEDVRWTQNRAR